MTNEWVINIRKGSFSISWVEVSFNLRKHIFTFQMCVHGSLNLKKRRRRRRWGCDAEGMYTFCEQRKCVRFDSWFSISFVNGMFGLACSTADVTYFTKKWFKPIEILLVLNVRVGPLTLGKQWVEKDVKKSEKRLFLIRHILCNLFCTNLSQEDAGAKV